MKAIITLEFVELNDDKNTAHPDRSFVRKQWCVSCPSLPFPFPFSSLSQLPTQHRYHPRLQPHHALRPPSLTDDVLIEFTDIHHEPRPRPPSPTDPNSNDAVLPCPPRVSNSAAPSPTNYKTSSGQLCTTCTFISLSDLLLTYLPTVYYIVRQT